MEKKELIKVCSSVGSFRVLPSIKTQIIHFHFQNSSQQQQQRTLNTHQHIQFLYYGEVSPTSKCGILQKFHHPSSRAFRLMINHVF